ncbi:uncharacterized protein [Chelonus insularis]|uniref:uncharacterized protein isoform X2 n=1 Tax=Chelonus insularis TaxID=460826 RepID=UPI00158A5CA3|nr:uncharacterized protein LOC118066620 isoform X2 [Chelonus insularis]
MKKKYISLLFMIIQFCKADVDECTYQYKYSCDKNENLRLLNDTNPLNCSLDNILENAEYTLILSKDGLTPTGILRINSFLPTVNCQYKVALLVNESVKTDEECKQHNFDNHNENEIHSLDQTICISAFDNSTIIEHESIDCKENNIYIYFKHIFTGCYALRYKIDHNYVIRSRQYISTTYQRREVEEPTFRCNYDNRPINNQRNLVTFTFGISVLPGSTSMSLELTPLSSEDENKEDACVEYSKAPQYAWEISLSGSNTQLEPLKSCKVTMVNIVNETSTEDVECSFSLPVSYDESYCFLITLHDSRCLRHTTWNPPPKNKSTVPCTWIPKCTKVNITSGIEYPGDVEGNSPVVSADLSSLLPIAAGIIIVTVVIGMSMVYLYRSRVRILREDFALNATLRNLKDGDHIELDAIDTDEEHTRAIVLLYARGSKPFMSFMLHFREILECYCGCHVFDWYAACEWDAVARVGACEWADSLIKSNHRIVWIDTPTARSLVNMTNNQNIVNKSSNDEQFNTDLINDFRDLAFPSVLEFAKRSIINIKSQYDKHFIVRIEGFNHDNSSEDIFANLSPHARFLIPYHLKQLCSHLSSKRSEAKNDALTTEEKQLKERLRKMNHHY